MSRVKIMIDPGHGGRDPGAVGHGLQEKDIVLDMGKALQHRLATDWVCDVRLTRSTDVFVPLSDRARMANEWGAAYFVSLHVNAGGGRGYEDFIWNGRVSAATVERRAAVHAAAAKAWTDRGRPNRGKKRANFAVLRETRMPAILVENGFIDNVDDTNLLRDTDFRAQVVRAMAVGIADALGLSAAPRPSAPAAGSASGQIFRVVAGSFRQRANADKRVEELRAAGFADIWVDTV